MPLMAMALVVWREANLPRKVEPARLAPQAKHEAVPEKTLAASALAVAFGFKPAGAPKPSLLDITLKASFVSSRGEARALVAGPGVEAVYRVGDRLPDGGVLRRIEGRAITFWFNGREHVVALTGSKAFIFQPSGSSVPGFNRDATPSRLLQEVQ